MRLFKRYLGTKNSFQSFWHGGRLSPLAWLSLSSFVKEGHDFELYCYQPLDVPAGVRLQAADQIIAMDRIFVAHGSYAPFADLFRFTLLHKKGGWWTDTDVVCTGNAIPKGAIVFGEERRGRINNAILRIPRRHELLDSVLHRLGGMDIENAGFGESGPTVLTECAKIHGLDHLSLPAHLFYPLSWVEAYKFILPEFTNEVASRSMSSPFVHIWNYMFLEQFGFDIAGSRPPKGSFLDQQYGKYLVYDAYALRETDEQDLRRKINEFVQTDSAMWWSREIGVNVSCVDVPSQ